MRPPVPQPDRGSCFFWAAGKKKATPKERHPAQFIVARINYADTAAAAFQVQG
jgi:hypothetical protein